MKISITLAAVMMLPSLASAPAASATGSVVGFRLVSPNTALATVFDEHHQPGDWIRVTGSGSFDPYAGWIEASGSFVHYNADGTVHMRGKWLAAGFTAFTPFPGPKTGKLGGILQLTVALFHQDGTPCDCMGEGGVAMTVTSTAFAPAGTSAETGTTMGPFQDPTGGGVGFSISDE
jgi:hypothetical protein